MMKVGEGELSAAHLLLVGEMGPLSFQGVIIVLKEQSLWVHCQKSFSALQGNKWSGVHATHRLFRPLEIKFING